MPYAEHNEGKDHDGELTVSTIIPNGEIQRKVFSRYYDQGAWSYNSENIPLPIEPGGERTVWASLTSPSGSVSRVKAIVQIVGYSK